MSMYTRPVFIIAGLFFYSIVPSVLAETEPQQELTDIPYMESQPSEDPTGIQVISATYGKNCGADEGNVTSHIADQCDGETECQYIVDYLKIGDPAFGCQKDYRVDYQCSGNTQIFSESLQAEAGWGDKSVELKCNQQVSQKPDAPPAPQTESRKTPLKIEGKKILLMRVLARPFSNIYNDKSTESGVVESNIPALKPFYVYEKPTPEEKELESGWYQVGTNNRGKIAGWMQAKDVFEWNQTMCLIYTHPEGRKPVLMFERQSTLKSLLDKPDDDRQKEINRYFSTIESQKIPDDFPVVSVEPKKAIDWKKEFYFLPILDHKAIQLGNREARLIRLTAATNTRPDARNETDIRNDENQEYVSDATEDSLVMPASIIPKANIDIVWVTDTTVSMRPFINQTINMIDNISSKIAEAEDVNTSINFGFWGYRDNLEAIPKIGYVTKNYTPELVSINQFKEVLKSVEVTPVDSIDYPEDMFSGVNDAIKNTTWHEQDEDNLQSMRFIILVGDAPSHEVGHDWNLSKQSASTLNLLAGEKNIRIFSIHINNPKAQRFEETARSQFTTLSEYKGLVDKSMLPFIQIDSNNLDEFLKKSNTVGDGIAILVDRLKNIYRTHSKPPQPDPVPQPQGEMAFTNGNVNVGGIFNEPFSRDDPNNETEIKVKAMFKAALVEWIGSQTNTKPPRDIVAWTIDKDLENPDIPSVEVRLLINKRQLDSLATVLDSIIKAGIQGQISGEDFFSSLQATTAMISRDPNLISQAKRIADTGLVPEFLVGLPYQSRLMAIDNELWEGWSADEQMNFINDMSTKVEAYANIHDSPEGWIKLNPEDEPDDHVYPISLDLLP